MVHEWKAGARGLNREAFTPPILERREKIVEIFDGTLERSLNGEVWIRIVGLISVVSARGVETQWKNHGKSEGMLRSIRCRGAVSLDSRLWSAF